MCELFDVDPASLSGAALSEQVVALAALRSRVEAALLGAVGEWDAHQEWAADACLNGQSWLVHNASMSWAEARAAVRDARLLREHPLTAAAVPTVGVRRARLVLGGINPRTAEAFAADEAMLLEQVGTLSVDHTARLVRWWVSQVDADGAEDRAARAHDRRRVSLSAGLDGVGHFDGLLDPEATALVKGALDAIGEELYRAEHGCVDGAPATTAPQRRADALVEMARRAMATDPDTMVAAKPVVFALVDLPTLECRAGRTCDVDDIGAITPGAARRLACDANIVRVITDGASAVLDLGTSTPTPNPAQRRALRIRDKGCVVPGCGRPPGWCEAHHLQPVGAQGPTDLANLCLLCSRHHHLHHAGTLGIARGPDGQLVFTRADGTTINRLPRAA